LSTLPSPSSFVNDAVEWRQHAQQIWRLSILRRLSFAVLFRHFVIICTNVIRCPPVSRTCAPAVSQIFTTVLLSVLFKCCIQYELPKMQSSYNELFNGAMQFL